MMRIGKAAEDDAMTRIISWLQKAKLFIIAALLKKHRVRLWEFGQVDKMNMMQM